MVMACSLAWRNRLACSCRNAARPMVSPSVAGLGGAVIWKTNLGFSLRAAQEFGLLDHPNAQRFRPLEFRPGVGPHDDGGGPLGDAVGHAAARSLDQLRRL